MSQVARSVDVHPSQLYRWRKELCFPLAGKTESFAEVVVQSDAGGPVRPPAIRVRLGGVEVEIGDHAPPALAAAVLQVLSR